MSGETKRLDEIEARLNAATPGPWGLQESSNGGAILLRGVEEPRARRHIQSHLQVVPTPDAELIANAPSDIAWLVEQVRARDEAIRVRDEAMGYGAASPAAPQAEATPLANPNSRNDLGGLQEGVTDAAKPLGNLRDVAPNKTLLDVLPEGDATSDRLARLYTMVYDTDHPLGPWVHSLFDAAIYFGRQLRAQARPQVLAVGSPRGGADAVTCFEVIDHRERRDGGNVGRIYSAWPCRVELSHQDGGRTLKVFVTDLLPDNGNNNGSSNDRPHGDRREELAGGASSEDSRDA